MSLRRDELERLERIRREDAYYAQDWVRMAEEREAVEDARYSDPLPRIPVRPESARMLGHFSRAQQDQWEDDMEARYGGKW